MLNPAPKFICSFNYCSEYEWPPYSKKTYEVRSGCHDSLIRADYLPTIKKTIGTIIRRDNVHSYPEPELVAHFNEVSDDGPFVAARWTEDWQVETLTPVPEPVRPWEGSWIMPSFAARIAAERQQREAA